MVKEFENMNLNWAFALLIWAVGNVLTPPSPSNKDKDVYRCPEPGCNKTFMTANGRCKHFKCQHTASSSNKFCQHGCGKSYSSNSQCSKTSRMNLRTESKQVRASISIKIWGQEIMEAALMSIFVLVLIIFNLVYISVKECLNNIP